MKETFSSNIYMRIVIDSRYFYSPTSRCTSQWRGFLSFIKHHVYLFEFLFGLCTTVSNKSKFCEHIIFRPNCTQQSSMLSSSCCASLRISVTTVCLLLLLSYFDPKKQLLKELFLLEKVLMLKKATKWFQVSVGFCSSSSSL